MKEIIINEINLLTLKNSSSKYIDKIALPNHLIYLFLNEESNHYSKNLANSQIVNLNSYFFEILSNESLICVNRTIFVGVSIIYIYI